MPGVDTGQRERLAGGNPFTMNGSQTPVLMDCAGDTLVGVVSQPEQPGALGMVIVVGGPQYRVGSHRQFVLLARCLAASGFPVLRFDYRGMGDSSGAVRCFDEISDDISTAIDTLQKTCPSVRRVVLWGLCDGASAALLYSGLHSDERLIGLCLLNPWVRSESTLARTHLKHYYPQRLLDTSFWKQLWRGEYAWKSSIAQLWQNVQSWRIGTLWKMAEPNFQQKMAVALRYFQGQVLLVLSERDYTAKEFLECAQTSPDWDGLLQRTTVRMVEMADADHTFSRAEWREKVEQTVLDWMQSL